MNGLECYLRIKANRGICEKCDDHPTTNQRLQWYDYKSRYTKANLDYLMLLQINSTLEDVAIKENLSADTIGRILNDKVAQEVDWRIFSKVGLIGVDEIAIRKGYNDYLTIITSRYKDKVRIIGVLKGRDKLPLKTFLKQIPYRLKKTIAGVCCDMNEGYINAALEGLKNKVPATFDRFHVAKKYRE